MTREEIEETDAGVLLDLNGKKNLLVTFGGVQQGIGVPVFEFFNSISEIDCDKIFLRDFKQAWYQKGIDSTTNNPQKIVEYLKKTISENNYEKVTFIGNSMGGYAAILFGSILNVDKVVSFAPQSYLDIWNRLRNKEIRWLKKIIKIYFYPKKRKNILILKNIWQNKKIIKLKLIFTILQA